MITPGEKHEKKTDWLWIHKQQTRVIIKGIGLMHEELQDEEYIDGWNVFKIYWLILEIIV